MSIYVLIHGAWHGGWCWNKVMPLLEQAGHTVVVPDLPGHGDDKTSPSEISLHSYVEHVCQILEKQSEPVYLVGHSMSGIVIYRSRLMRGDTPYSPAVSSKKSGI